MAPVRHIEGAVSAPIIITEDDMVSDPGKPSKKRRSKNSSNNNNNHGKSSGSGKMPRSVSMPTTLFDIESIMKFRTIDESLHSNYGSEPSNNKGNISFDKVKVREYNRTVGDNPSCSSGPPVSIGWKYNIVADVSLDMYENTRPPRRSHFEMVLPRKVRYDMLKRDWDVKQKDIAESVRRNVKVKNQRKATVNNLGKATKMELAMESAGRKLKRLMLFQKPVSQQVQELDAKFQEAERRRNQRRLELQMASEYSESSRNNQTPEAVDTSTSST